MRWVNYILLGLFVITGCDNRIDPDKEKDENIVATNKYIFFDTERLTRGTSIENYLYDNFYVIGYKYVGDWLAVRPQASQTNNGVFDNKPQTVTYNNSAHSYKPLKKWDEQSTYSYFAWYPTSASLCNDNGGSYTEGEPYIKYTIDKSNPGNHMDILTACVIDRRVNWQDVSSKTVSFNMKHRLSALDIVARSYVNAASFDVAGVNTANVVIRSINITLGNSAANATNSLLYDTAIIPLNTNDRELTLKGGKSTGYNGVITYNTISSNVAVDYYSSSINLANITSNDGKTMFLIPQESPSKCIMTVTYDIVGADGTTSVWDTVYQGVGDAPNKTQTQEVDIKRLQEGMRYYLLVNITKSGVSVVVLDTEAWDDKKVDYEFE